MSIIEKYWHRLLRRPYRLKCAIDQGEGQAVVLLHGIASTGESWRYVTDNLEPSKYRVVALDLLGFGNSPRPSWLEYSVEDHARSVLLTLRRMRVREPFILVGHSMGSLVAAEIAHEHPSKVRHLILHQMPLYNAGLETAQKRDFAIRAYRKGMGFIVNHPQMTLAGARMLGRAAAKLGGFTLTKDTWHPFEMSLKNTILLDAGSKLHELSMPTDVIYGKYDLLVLKKNARQYFAPTPQVRFYQINDIHRVSIRSGRLIADLVAQDADKNRMLGKKHDTLLTRFTMNKRQAKTDPITPKQHHLDRRQTLLLAAFFGAAFLLTALSALNRTVTGWELNAFIAFNVWDSPEYVTWFARIISDTVWVMVGLLALAVLWPRTHKPAFKIAMAVGITYVTGYILEHIINRARPDVLLHGEAIARAMQDGPGFVSGHMLAATAIVCVVWYRLSGLMRILVVLLLVLEAWSRVYLGLHFPLDVIGGALLAITVHFVLISLPNKLRIMLRMQ